MQYHNAVVGAETEIRKLQLTNTCYVVEYEDSLTQLRYSGVYMNAASRARQCLLSLLLLFERNKIHS